MTNLSLLFTAMLLLAPGGDREKGLQLYREGRFQEAAAAFEAAISSEGDSAELQYNLALARWRGGDLGSAEIAVEKYVAMAGDARTDLHAGVLGAVRFDEAKALEAKADALIAGAGNAGPQQVPTQPPVPQAQQPAQPEDPLPLLEQALVKAVQAKDHFVRGAVAVASPELQRNTERTLRYLAELQKKIDELKKQREEQEKDDEQKPDDKNDTKDDKDKKDEEKKDEQKKDEKQQDDKKQEGEKKPDEQPKEGEGESKPEPKPGEQEPEPKKPDEQGKPQEGKPEEQKPPEPKPGEEQKDGKPEQQKPRNDAPGEVEEGKELSPEQAQRVLDELKKLDAQLQAYRARAKSGRKPVERDW